MSDYFLADDLSGALDAAAAFHRAGRRVRIVLSPTAWDHAAADEVVGLTTETRNALPEIAAASVTAAIGQGQVRGGRLRFKKIDSTLRGPVAAELGALAVAMPGTRILFCPANPSVGRTVRAGVLRVHGVPVAETEFARDPVNPVRESAIARLLGAEWLSRIDVPDAETEADLAAAVARMDAGKGAWVAVGSGALARPVAARMARAPADAEDTVRAIPPGPVLMVGGSAHRLTREQALAWARVGGVPLREVRVAAGGPAVIAALEDLRTRDAAALVPETARGDSAAVLRALTAAAKELVATAGVRRVFVTGGETAFALCRAFEISSLRFVAEIESGLSLSRGGAPGGEVLLAVKPGGFGEADSWVKAWQFLASAR